MSSVNTGPDLGSDVGLAQVLLFKIEYIRTQTGNLILTNNKEYLS